MALSEKEYFYGHKACAGCGGSLAVRMALKVLGDDTYVVVPAGCMSAVSFTYPQFCFLNNAIVAPFAATASVATGIAAAAKVQGKKDVHVVGIAGDGGTADIGLQALSGAIDRNDQILYICYDNEAYMNTGIQKSGLTPYGARTTTTPAGEKVRGNYQEKKNIFEIIAAHGISYAATASVGYIDDYIQKVERAMNTKGTSFIHVLAPCPTGWGTSPADTIQLAREIVDSGLWYLAEYKEGQFYLNRDPEEFSSVGDYLQKQSRFSHLTEEDIDVIENSRNEKWKKIREWRVTK